MSLFDENVKALAFYRENIPLWWNHSTRHFGKIEAKNYSTEEFWKLASNQQVSHCLWMCEDMQRQVKETNGNIAIDKVARWLGFIQGVTIVLGLTDISVERDRTRPWFSKDN